MGELPESEAIRTENSAASGRPPLPWLAAFAIAVALCTTLASVGLAGLWDPPELQNAEFARRVARDLLGAAHFAADSSEAPLTREALGRGELPFLSIALGFRAFGLSSVAGRVALALWGLAGLGTLHFVLRRLCSPRAAWLAVLVLASTPLYFVHARTLLGDVVTFTAQMLAFGGLAVAIFDAQSGRVRAISGALATLGLLAGLLSRGLIVGVAVPTLGVGLAWLTLAFSGAKRDRVSETLGAAALISGAATALAGALIIAQTPDEVFSFWLAGAPTVVRPQPTFDVVVRDVGHALFPWSALILPALGRALYALREVSEQREQGLRLGLLATVGAAGVAHTALTPWFGLQAFSACAALAALVALALDDIERGAPASRWFGFAVAATLVLLLLDFRNFPEKGLVAFSVSDAVLPPRFASWGFGVLAATSVPLGAIVFFLVQAPNQTTRRVFRRREYWRWPRIVRRVWGGNLWVLLLALGSSCFALEIMRWVSDRALHLSAFESMPELARAGVRFGWLLTLAFLLVPLAVLLGRDVTQVVLRWPWRGAEQGKALRRGGSAVSVFAVSGVVLSFGYYGALASELSPKRAFDLYKRQSADAAPLGLLGVNPAMARYQAGVPGKALRDGDEAAAFLLENDQPRFLALRANELASVNAVFRARTTPRRNVHVLDAHSSDIVLASNRSSPASGDDNPFARWVLSAPPSPRHPLDVDLAGKLTVLGWDVFDARGNAVSSISPGREYEFAIYYRVEQRVAGNWDTFLHIDGFQRRFNGDHPTLGGHYPFPLWLPGDIMVDRHTIRLGPEFSSGTYRVYFGLYSGSRRLEVRRGAHSDDRIAAGSIDVK
ncbi:MAG: ArnT family glycosyltransferase [Myxococcota bacterium]